MSNVNDLPTVSESDYNATEAVTLTDLANAYKVTRLTANKRLGNAGVEPVAKLSTGKAGRPPVLFPRAAADAALAVQRSQSQVRAANDAVAQAAADALAE